MCIPEEIYPVFPFKVNFVDVLLCSSREGRVHRGPFEAVQPLEINTEWNNSLALFPLILQSWWEEKKNHLDLIFSTYVQEFRSRTTHLRCWLDGYCQANREQDVKSRIPSFKENIWTCHYGILRDEVIQASAVKAAGLL